MLRRVGGVAAIVHLLAGFVLAAGGFLFVVFRCFDDSCRPTSSDWAERAGAWQASAVLWLSLGTLLAVLLLTCCLLVVYVRASGKRTGLRETAFLTVPPLVIETGLLAALFVFASSTHRSVGNGFGLLLSLVLVTGVAAVLGALRMTR